ncbi:MAG: hypothetical protein V4717_09500 [Bacteroidota bacterium]
MNQNNKDGAKTTGESTPQHKGESQKTNQKGAVSVSKKGKKKHTKDDSEGTGKMTTKKQGNSI